MSSDFESRAHFRVVLCMANMLRLDHHPVRCPLQFEGDVRHDLLALIGTLLHRDPRSFP